MIRALRLEDIAQLKEIHEKYYRDEFAFPFLDKFLGMFVVIEDDTIISAGGVRNIAESVIITNKNQSVRKRREALYQLFDAHAWLAGKNGFDGLHAFVQDDIWRKHLESVGFHNTKGQALVLEI